MKKRLILLTGLLATNAYALNDGFDFGQECGGGSGSFEQQINYFNGDYENAITVGDIPAGIKDLKITLTSDKDVDIRLYSGSDKIVHWPSGLLKSSSQKSADYKGATVTYSGYNGTEGERGHEFIEIEGATPAIMTMKAFGYKAGFSTVNYSWSGKENCSQDQGNGSFTQSLAKNALSTVGIIPAGIGELTVALKSDKDLDIQLYAEDGTAIVAWPKGLIHGSQKQTIDYDGMHIEWSGYNGDGTGRGHEYIKITGDTTESLTMKAYGYQAGFADVTYSWESNNIENGKQTVQMKEGISYTVSKGDIIEKVSTSPKIEISIDKYTGKTKAMLKEGQANIKK